jgi:hypothetical protein
MKLTTHLHLVPRSENEWSYTSTPQYAFMVWCLVKGQGQLYPYLTLYTYDIKELSLSHSPYTEAKNNFKKRYDGLINGRNI